MDKLQSLKFFIRLVEKNGVAVAGRDFGLSAASASERLAKLERDYGAKLVNRTTRSLSLTDEGRILFEGARSLVDNADDLERQIKHGMDRVSGPLKIAAPMDIGSHLISNLVDRFVEENPEIKISLLLSDENIDLVGQGIDVAIRLGPMKDSTMRVRKLADNRRLVVASPAYVEKYGMPSSPNDLHSHNCLIMHWGRSIDREWYFKVNGRRKKITVSGNRAANSGAQVKRWCLDGRGIAFKSIWDVNPFLKSGALIELLSEYHLDQESAVQLLYPGGNKPPRRVRAFIDFLVEHFESEDVIDV